jgi:hypothetical protein
LSATIPATPALLLANQKLLGILAPRAMLARRIGPLVVEYFISTGVYNEAWDKGRAL